MPGEHGRQGELEEGLHGDYSPWNCVKLAMFVDGVDELETGSNWSKAHCYSYGTFNRNNVCRRFIIAIAM